MRKILLVSNTAWSIYNFRAGLISSLLANGYEVLAVAPQDAYSAKLPRLGCKHIALEMDNKGTNPIRDAQLLLSFVRLFRRERPLCAFCYTIKPNVYGSIAARLTGVPVINNVAGLGSVFSRPSWVTPVAKFLYRRAFRTSSHVFFQNADDLKFFERLGLARPGVASLLPGSGVDIERFHPINQPAATGQDGLSFLMMGRMLWEKGVGEYVEAAKVLKSRFPKTKFKLLGFIGVPNPSAVPRSSIEEWTSQGLIEYLGETHDVVPYIAGSDCVVLPSYYGEGTPRSLLEAASMAKPLITTDMPGCRDAVEHGQTGLLVRPRDVKDLAEKMESLIRLDAQERARFGSRAREKMIREFDERIVIAKYLRTIENVMAARTTS